MAILLTILAIIAVLMLASRAAPTPRGASLPPQQPDADQLDLLLREGTNADAAHLAEQGVDLRALGYRPPHDG